MRDVDADYYGYRDDDDGILIPLEEKAEKLAIAEAVRVWKERQQRKAEGGAPGDQVEEEEEEDIYPVDEEYEKAQAAADEENNTHGLLAPKFKAHVPVPSQQDIEAAILKKKKQELLEKYGIAD